MEEAVKVWGAAFILLILTGLYIGIGIWAAKREWLEDAKSVLVWLSLAVWSGTLIGLWCTWVYQLLVVTS